MQAWIGSELQDLIFVGNSFQASGSTPQIVAVIVADFPMPLLLRHRISYVNYIPVKINLKIKIINLPFP